MCLEWLTSYIACAMNESKSVLQAENQPLFLCPVCLRKLQKAVGFDIVERYTGLCILLDYVMREILSKEDSYCHSGDTSVQDAVCKSKGDHGDNRYLTIT